MFADVIVQEQKCAAADRWVAEDGREVEKWVQRRWKKKKGKKLIFHSCFQSNFVFQMCKIVLMRLCRLQRSVMGSIASGKDVFINNDFSSKTSQKFPQHQFFKSLLADQLRQILANCLYISSISLTQKNNIQQCSTAKQLLLFTFNSSQYNKHISHTSH